MKCTERTGPIWAAGGESCGCVLDAVHVFTPGAEWHRCSCRTTWVDEEQVQRARREGQGAR